MSEITGERNVISDLTQSLRRPEITGRFDKRDVRLVVGSLFWGPIPKLPTQSDSSAKKIEFARQTTSNKGKIQKNDTLLQFIGRAIRDAFKDEPFLGWHASTILGTFCGAVLGAAVSYTVAKARQGTI